MAVGDAAKREGYSLVPDTGAEGRVRWGAREINRTRDYIAAVKRSLPSSKAAYRKRAGISSGTSNPSGGDNGDIYFKIIT